MPLSTLTVAASDLAAAVSAEWVVLTALEAALDAVELVGEGLAGMESLLR